MKLAPRLAWALLLLAGCAKAPPFKVGDTLVSTQDGAVLGKVVEIGTHSFANGLTAPSLHVITPAGREAWYSIDTTLENYRVRD